MLELNKKTILVDMDDVITNGNFEYFLEEFLGEKIDFNKIKGTFRQVLIEGREEEFKAIYQDRNLYQDAPLLEGCYEVLKRLNDKYDIYIVTSYIWGKDVINPAENLKNKYNYLREKLDFIDPRKYVFVHNKNLMKFDVVIDDRLSWLEHGETKLLFSAWGNRSISAEELKSKNIIRVDSWYDVERILLEEASL